MTKLEIIRANPYPCVSGLHFYPENIYWDNIGRKYITRFIDTPLRYYINDQENSLTGNAYSAHRETIFVRLHFINECWDYAKSNPKFFIKQFVGLSRDGLLNGKRFSEIKKMPDTFSKRALAVIFYPMRIFCTKTIRGKQIMKKVGIVTFHRALNYGAVLQSYALQKPFPRSVQSVKLLTISVRKSQPTTNPFAFIKTTF